MKPRTPPKKRSLEPEPKSYLTADSCLHVSQPTSLNNNSAIYASEIPRCLDSPNKLDSPFKGSQEALDRKGLAPHCSLGQSQVHANKMSLAKKYVQQELNLRARNREKEK